MSDPAKYRTREEVQNIKDKKDPIENFQKHLLNEGLDEDEFKKIDKNIKEIVSEAADFALESSEPDLTDLYEDIYLDD
jgi:pyruvate dehydrogenase E1 component alpha subunit